MIDEPESGGRALRPRGRFFIVPMLVLVVILVCMIVIILTRTAWRAIGG